MRSSVTAEAIARALAATGKAWCWFDGAAAPVGEPSVSYFGLASEVRVAAPGREREFLRELRSASGTDAGAGWAVALSYEFGVGLMGLEPVADETADGKAAASAFALRLTGVLALDHETGQVSVLGETDLGDIDLSGAAFGAGPAKTGFGSAGLRGGGGSAIPHPTWRRSDDEYAAEVSACKAAIGDGDAYVLCLTDTAEARAAGPVDPLALYLKLRAQGGAVRGGVIVAGDRALVSASPERFLSVSGGVVTTHPIKGTRPRGATPELDLALALELQRDEKERAENLMIVDLMRNDLSRVCEVGSVRVDGFLHVETHPHVHQLVSTITGQAAAGHDVFDVIEATFPGGSMTGAPKRRAIELLAGLEAGPRGLYSGCFGWIGDDGEAELAMTIRSVELRQQHDHTELRIGAGGGITADSDPAAETAEKHLKAAALLAQLR